MNVEIITADVSEVNIVLAAECVLLDMEVSHEPYCPAFSQHVFFFFFVLFTFIIDLE